MQYVKPTIVDYGDLAEFTAGRRAPTTWTPTLPPAGSAGRSRSRLLDAPRGCVSRGADRRAPVRVRLFPRCRNVARDGDAGCAGELELDDRIDAAAFRASRSCWRQPAVPTRAKRLAARGIADPASNTSFGADFASP
jgi:hypothetical protein